MPNEYPEFIIDESDAEVIALLDQLLADLAAVAQEYDVLHRDAPTDDSVLGADNTATHPFQIGHFVGYCMLQAVDTCRSITRVVRDENGKVTLPIMSVFTLARSVIECAATAVWVLQPSDRRSRALRRLQFAHSELTHETELVKTMAVSFDKSEEQAAIRTDKKSRDGRNADLRAIADAIGIAYNEYENQFPGWLAIIEAAGTEFQDENVLPSIWRMCSGMSHPSLSRGLNLLKFNQMSESGNILRGTLSVNTANVVGVLAITHLSVRKALARWRAAKGQLNSEHPVPVPEPVGL